MQMWRLAKTESSFREKFFIDLDPQPRPFGNRIAIRDKRVLSGKHFIVVTAAIFRR